ncbi:MAG: methionyl-tRNA formyltransferase [Thermodesulfobacteriota bacterium]
MADIKKIIFMGTPAFAVPSLQTLIDRPEEEVVAVVCQPDRRQGRGRKLMPPPVKELAQRHGIPVLQPTKIRTQGFLDEIKGYGPDLIVVTAYGRILPGPLLNLPPLGTINVHGSLLPKYRGAAPVQRAILAGETETGITIMAMDEGMDTGDILLPGSMIIEPSDTAASLAVKMAALGGHLLDEALDLLRADRLPPIPQDDALATEAPLLNKEEAPIDWSRSAKQISCQIRGLDPWPKARCQHNDTCLYPFSPEVAAEDEVPQEAAPGTVLTVGKNNLTVATGDGVLRISEIQAQGKKRMGVSDFSRGYDLKPGDILS